jgi:hypothetical protein
VDLACLMAGVLWDHEREKLFNIALEEAAASGSMVLVLERLELAVATVPLTPWLLAGALNRARLAATCLPSSVQQLDEGPLARRMDLIEITELAREDAAAVLGHLRDTLVAHHGVAIDAPVVEAVVARSLSLAGKLPDKAVTLLDAAAARAALLKQPEVTLSDVYLAASRMKEAQDEFRTACNTGGPAPHQQRGQAPIPTQLRRSPAAAKSLNAGSSPPRVRLPSWC